MGCCFPNGTVITPDGQTLIVAETFGHRLTAFDIQPDGTLSHRRVWADLEGAFPDGICLDAEGAIWVAAPEPGRGAARPGRGPSHPPGEGLDQTLRLHAGRSGAAHALCLHGGIGRSGPGSGTGRRTD